MNTQSIGRLASLVILGLGACDSSSGGTPQDGGNLSEAAIELFWSTYHDNAYAHIPEVQAALQGAIDKDPDNGELYAFLGATHFWHVGEYTRDPHPDLSVLQQDLPTAIQMFQRAAALDPNDDHLPGLIGVTIVHAGQLTHDATLIAQGDQILDIAVYRFPEYNSFNWWAAHNGDPKDSPTYQNALNHLWAAFDACAGASVDRTNPDATPYLYL